MKKAFSIILAVLAIAAFSSCSKTKSYATLLNEENVATNCFLADQRVIPFEKRDYGFAFETGKDAPYYQLDEEGNIFMQVLNPGTPDNQAASDQLIYFRFTRYNLRNYANGTLPSGEGNNASMAGTETAFRFSNMNASNSYQWGSGLQQPLKYLPIDCEVNLVIKSQYGLYSEIASVNPYMYNIRYFKSQI